MGRQWPAPLRSMRHRDFRRFWFGLIVSVVGTWMQMAAQAWLVYELTDSPLALGLVGACGTAPMLLFSLPAGVVADRLSKRNILLVTQSVAMLQAFALAALVYSGAVQVWHVMVLAAFLGTSNSFDMPARHAMVIELAGREDVLNAVSLNSSAFNSGRIVGPALAGVLIGAVGTAVCFLINGVSFVATIIALAGIAPRPPRPEAQG
ncbi:MAG TPA: MFS transporter, partial [Armatimonadota bacterium]|nr:MFS transporter [Armatimonadota bacterium]